MRKVITLLLSFIFFSAICALAQKDADKGSIKIKGGTYYLDDKDKKVAVPFTNIVVYKGTEKIQEVQSNKKGLYELTLEYGSDYKIAFENNPGYIHECFAVEAAKVPVAKQDLKTTIEMDGVLISDTRTDIDTVKFNFPYTKLKFDGNKKFMDDAKYLQDFTKGLFKEYKAEKAKIKKEEAAKIDNAKKEAGIRYKKISGKLFSGKPATKPVKGVKINLIDEKGNVVETSTTNKLGRFGFNKIDASKNYTLKAEGSDTSALNNSAITIFNKLGTEVASMTANEKGGFNFQLLNSDQKTFGLMQVDDNTLSMSGTFFGQMKNGDAEVPLKNTLVVLVNTKGQIVDRATTNDEGNFAFTKLPADQNVMVRIEELDPAFKGMNKAILKDMNGKVIAKVENGGLGTFEFRFLAQDENNFKTMEVEDTKTISGLFSGQMKDGTSKPLKNNKILLVNGKGEEVGNAVTDEKGFFAFENLASDQNYFVKIDELDPAYKGMTKLTMKDANGKIIAAMNNDGMNAFQFSFLAPQQKNFVSNMLVDEMSIRMTLKGRMLTGDDTKSTPFTNLKVDLYNTEGTLLKSTQTDEKGNFVLKGMKLQLGYYLLLDASNSQLTAAKNLLMADSKGKVYKESELTPGAEYKFHLLISDEMSLANFYAK